jgi:guanylate kinase
MRGSILVISGPSGCGKSSLLSECIKKYNNIYFSISTTTREMREGEQDGVNYHYIPKKEFEKEIAEGFFLEWARVHDNYYGTSLKPIEKALEDGKLVIFDIDVQGHELVRKQFNDITTSVFITTPNSQTLRDRLVKRATDSWDVIVKRLMNSKEEMKRISEYDFLLINDDFKTASEEFESVLKVAQLKISNKQIVNFTNTWYNEIE